MVTMKKYKIEVKDAGLVIAHKRSKEIIKIDFNPSKCTDTQIMDYIVALSEAMPKNGNNRRRIIGLIRELLQLDRVEGYTN